MIRDQLLPVLVENIGIYGKIKSCSGQGAPDDDFVPVTDNNQGKPLTGAEFCKSQKTGTYGDGLQFIENRHKRDGNRV